MLKLVPKSEPPAKEKVRRRIKQMRPDGVLMCNRCGGLTVMTATSGVTIVNGRKQGGTVVEKDVCADCYKHEVYSPMLPELERIK